MQNDLNIDDIDIILTVGPSGPGGPSISMPCEDDDDKRVMVRVDTLLYNTFKDSWP